MAKEQHIAAYIVTFIVLCAAVAGLLLFMKTFSASSIQSFQDCKDAGYPIIESYPEQCMAEGRVFTNSREVSY